MNKALPAAIALAFAALIAGGTSASADSQPAQPPVSTDHAPYPGKVTS